MAIRVDGVSKVYNLYGNPRDRLKQFVYPRVRKALGAAPRAYYREFWALRDISFEVEQGEAVGIVGRNGSGKSTLLQIITGTLAPTAGSVSVNGRVAGLLELGAGFNPEFSGRENVFMSGALLGLSRREIEEKFDDVAAFADIGEHLDQPTKTYSSGMLVRLAFAVHVQLKPDILIVDEALAVGDALFQKRCFSKIASLRDQGVTLLFVSHDQETVRTLTNRALLLREGRAVTFGPSADVIFAYRRQLHEEEVQAFTSGFGRQRAPSAAVDPVDPNDALNNSGVDTVDPPDPRNEVTRQFGTYDVEVRKVEVLGEGGEAKPVYYPGDRQEIRITLVANKKIKNLNVFIRIRNKEGVKIYSWGTMNQDQWLRSSGAQEPLFWERQFEAGEEFSVKIHHDCPLGPNLYEVQAGVAQEKDLEYGEQKILHWVDEAAFFTMAIKRLEYFFGGINDLRATAECV
ncbi:lipopolysaccharide transport system ATP-binding protein [Chelatococcus caeni]|uniref:Lipopolysaccharide transport system ATP-binding protein n=1 Tax=Chelatococcus caeni TaxID=1348468 RepID=A0A840BTY2_9HYPH|nr:ABC transporter ATP-binding protein [Chelatococcus caeni]MBB4016043.1 lipopolysaccharide transport system ATP-binding protein [Chelatococcus caeni]